MMVLEYLPPPIAAYLQNPYIFAVVILLAFYLLSQLFVFICQKIILKVTVRTKTELDDRLIRSTNRPISFLLFLFGLRIALSTLTIFPETMPTVKNIVETVILATITYIVIVAADAIINSARGYWSKKTESHLQDELISLFHKTSWIIIGIIGFIIILSSWDVEVGPFLASLGIAGIAIGFALQDSLKNIFGGISLILDQAYRVGDRLRLDNGIVGVVTEIGIRSTSIRTFDNEALIIPNGQLANMVIHNETKPDLKVRGKVEFNVEYGADPEKVKKLTLEVLKKNLHILKDPEPFVKFERMGDFGLIFIAFFWTATPDDRPPVTEEVTTAIYKTLNKAKIGIPFPTRTVYLRK